MTDGQDYREIFRLVSGRKYNRREGKVRGIEGVYHIQEPLNGGKLAMKGG